MTDVLRALVEDASDGDLASLAAELGAALAKVLARAAARGTVVTARRRNA